MSPRLRNHWLHASGGLLWHARALRYRRRLWQTFCATVAAWLREWQPPREWLLIVGPSAGYSLNEDFLLRWREVVAIEPDPLARALLRLRFPKIPWRFVDVDVFASDENVFRECFAEHAVLFANVLGQITPRDEEPAARWLAALRRSLASHYWASYHDIISTTRKPDREARATGKEESLDEVLAAWWQGGEVQISDHGCFRLGDHGHRNSAYCVWPMQPGAYHVVEWLTGMPATREEPVTRWSERSGG